MYYPYKFMTVCDVMHSSVYKKNHDHTSFYLRISIEITRVRIICKARLYLTEDGGSVFLTVNTYVHVCTTSQLRRALFRI